MGQLVLHQSQQGRDHQHRAWQDQGWQLVAQRLARPCKQFSIELLIPSW